MSTTKMLKVSPNELIVLEALLENFITTKPNDVLLSMSKNILLTIKDKKENCKSEFENKNFVEVSNNLKALIKGEGACINIKDESICKSCHHEADNKCAKNNEICNYWGEESGIKIIESIQKNNIYACVFFELRKIFEIINIKEEEKECYFHVKVIQDNIPTISIYKKQIVEFLIFKYGQNSFTNLKEYEEQLQFAGV